MSPLRWVALTTAVAIATLAGAAVPAQADVMSITVPAASETGVFTGISLGTGDSVSITATGVAQTASWQQTTDPDGLWPGGGSASCVGIPETCLAQTTASALVGRVGDGEWTLVGSGPTVLTGVGQVWLAYNDAIGFFGDNSGSYTATLDVTRAVPPCSTSTVRQPVNADGSSIFKLGSTVPVKFLCDRGDLNAKLVVQKISSTLLSGATLEAEVLAASDSTFRYDASSGQYIYNLSTKGLTTGTYRLKISFGSVTTPVIEAQLALR